MELNYWVDTECIRAKYNQETQDWIVKVKRGGKSIDLVSKQLVFATGMSGVPNIPEVPGAHLFEGEKILGFIAKVAANLYYDPHFCSKSTIFGKTPCAMTYIFDKNQNLPMLDNAEYRGHIAGLQ